MAFFFVVLMACGSTVNLVVSDLFRKHTTNPKSYFSAVPKFRLISFFVILAMLFVSPALAAGPYTITDLGTFGGSYSEARDINAAGQVVGTSYTAGDNETRAFFWEGGVMTDLGTLGGSSSSAFAINEAGQVIGWSFTAGTANHAFLWEGGVMTDLGTLGGTTSRALAINEAGQVIGYAKTAGDAEQHAFLWEDGVMTDLGTFGGSSSTAAAINEAGQVVGASYTVGNAGHAFLWEGGVMTDLGTFGGSSSAAAAINEAGQVVGYAYTAGNAEQHAFLWEGGVMTDLGTLGGSQGRATGINEAGQVIGFASTAGNAETHAFIAMSANQAPTANAGGSYGGNEGSAIAALSGATASDPDLDPLTYAWTVDSALCSFDDASALNPNLTCADNGSYTATLSVEDGVNPAVSSDASVMVSNVAPTLGAISVDVALVPVNTAINASADFTDPGVLDTHTASWDWGDGTSAGTVTQGTGSGSVSDSHSYSTPGVYTLKLTTTDDDGGVSDESVYQYVVVYDPSGGFVTGGGWIDSPAGAYTADPSLSGKANFGFVAKYKKGANVPDGNTQFQFKAGDLNFHSSSYEWLVVAGNKAQFKGEGTINGQGSYKFMITADDDSPDTFRIHIWDDNGTVYDNGSQQSLGGGSIVIHK